jgi:hypothetical protein
MVAPKTEKIRLRCCSLEDSRLRLETGNWEIEIKGKVRDFDEDLQDKF